MSAKVKTADIVKAVALALFTPTTIFFAIAKKVYYVDGVKSNNDFIILHLILKYQELLEQHYSTIYS